MGKTLYLLILILVFFASFVQGEELNPEDWLGEQEVPVSDREFEYIRREMTARMKRLAKAFEESLEGKVRLNIQFEIVDAPSFDYRVEGGQRTVPGLERATLQSPITLNQKIVITTKMLEVLIDPQGREGSLDSRNITDENIRKAVKRLTGIMGHEVGHLIDHMDLGGLERSGGKRLLIIGGLKDQDVELRADFEGIRLLWKAGFPPDSLHEGLSHLRGLVGANSPVHIGSLIKAGASTHPPLETRLSGIRLALLALRFSSGVDDRPEPQLSAATLKGIRKNIDRVNRWARQSPRSLEKIQKEIEKEIATRKKQKSPWGKYAMESDKVKWEAQRMAEITRNLQDPLLEVHQRVKDAGEKGVPPSELRALQGILTALIRAEREVDSFPSLLATPLHQSALEGIPFYRGEEYKRMASEIARSVDEKRYEDTVFSLVNRERILERTLQGDTTFFTPSQLAKVLNNKGSEPSFRLQLLQLWKMKEGGKQVLAPEEYHSRLYKLMEDLGPQRAKGEFHQSMLQSSLKSVYLDFLKELWNARGELAVKQACFPRSEESYTDWSKVAEALAVPGDAKAMVDQSAREYLASPALRSWLDAEAKKGKWEKDPFFKDLGGENRITRHPNPYLSEATYSAFYQSEAQRAAGTPEGNELRDRMMLGAYQATPKRFQQIYRNKIAQSLSLTAENFTARVAERHQQRVSEANAPHQLEYEFGASLFKREPVEVDRRFAVRDVFLEAFGNAHQKALQELHVPVQKPTDKDSIEQRILEDYSAPPLEIPLSAEMAFAIEALPISSQDKKNLLGLYFDSQWKEQNGLTGVMSEDPWLRFQEMGTENLEKVFPILKKHGVVGSFIELIEKLQQDPLHHQRKEVLLGSSDLGPGSSLSILNVEKDLKAWINQQLKKTAAHLAAADQMRLVEHLHEQIAKEIASLPRDKKQDLLKITRMLFSPTFHNIPDPENLRVVESQTEGIRALRRQILNAAPHFSLTGEEKWELHRSLTRTGSNLETDAYLESLLPSDLSAEKERLGRVLKEGRIHSLSLREKLAEAYMGEKLKASERIASREEVNTTVKEILSIFPESSQVRDKLFTKLIWSHGVDDVDTLREIESFKSTNLKLVGDGKQSRALSVASEVLRDFTPEERMSLIRHLSRERSAIVPAKVQEALARNIRKIPIPAEIARNGNAEIARYRNSLLTTAVDNIALLSVDGTVEQRTPIIENLLASGEKPLLDSNNVDRIADFLRGELSFKKDSTEERELLAYFDSVSSLTRAGSLAYLLAQSNAQGKFDHRELAKLFDTVGYKGLQSGVIWGFFPPEYSDVKDNTPPLDKMQALELLREHLSPEEFGQIKRLKRILGSASVKTIYLAELQDGTDAVIELVRPNGEEKIETNLNHLKRYNEARDKRGVGFFATLLHSVASAMRSQLFEEIDLTKEYPKRLLQKKYYESLNTELKAQGAPVRFSVPSQKTGFTPRKKVLVTTVAKGVHFDKLSREWQQKIGPLLNMAAFRSFLQEGIYDGDRHTRNVLVDVSDPQNIVIHPIDFGQTASYSKRLGSDERYRAAQWLRAWGEQNAEGIVQWAMALMPKRSKMTKTAQSALVQEIAQILRQDRGALSEEDGFKKKILNTVEALARNGLHMKDTITFTFLKGLMYQAGEGYSSMEQFNKMLEEEVRYFLTGEKRIQAGLDEYGFWGLCKRAFQKAATPRASKPLLPTTSF